MGPVCGIRAHAHTTHMCTHTHTHIEQKTKARHLAVSDSGQFYALLPAPFSCHVNQTQALEVRCRKQRETSRPIVCETARCLCASCTSGCVYVCVCVRVLINRRSLSSMHRGAEEGCVAPMPHLALLAFTHSLLQHSCLEDKQTNRFLNFVPFR